MMHSARRDGEEMEFQRTLASYPFLRAGVLNNEQACGKKNCQSGQESPQIELPSTPQTILDGTELEERLKCVKRPFHC